MSLKELQKFTFVSKYARYLPDKKRRETWKETVDRVKQMMLDKYHDKPIREEIEWAYDMVFKKRVLGSQRALQFGGKPIFDKHSRLYNCSASYCDRIRFFQECMYVLLCGTGTGFSVQQHHVAKLPKLIRKKNGTAKFVIPDTIEGWADAVGVLISSYFQEPNGYQGKTVHFDYSQIRPEGSYLSSSSGKAPGPEPLKSCISNIRRLLDECLKEELEKLKPIHAYDIVMYLADAVLSGGVRRSATVCLFSLEDKEMMNAKIGDWFYENPQRGRSNNSVVLIRNKTTKEQFQEIIKSTREFGEPGFVFADDYETLYNPCLEINLYAYDLEGNSGWQYCNLSTINCAKIKTEEDFYEACKAAAIIGTLQAGFTEFNYLGNTTEEIVKREALLGISMTGIAEQHEICLNPKIQKRGANLIKKINKEIAQKIGIRQAARTTCVKPEGTSSCLLGTSSGIHPHHSTRYLRRTQVNRSDPVYQYLKKYNPWATESSVWSANDTDDVVSFCIEVPDGSKTKQKVSALELLKDVKSTQINWVMEGKNKDLCIKDWLCHNVSNTITVKENEWNEVADFIYKNREYFCCVSLLPFSGDKDYPQAPFSSIHLPSEMIRMYGDGAVFVSGLIERALELYEDNLWEACDALLGIGKHSNGSAKSNWIERCKRFAGKYMDGDVKRLSYAMKDTYLYKDWLDLKRQYQPVDYENLIEEHDNTKLEEAVACAGGSCEI